MTEGKKSRNITQSSVISELTKAINKLIAVIEKENKLLKIGKMSEIRPVIEEKVNALQIFNEASNVVEEFVRGNNRFDDNSSGMTKLKELFLVLNNVNEDNNSLIRANLEISAQIVEMYKANKIQSTLRQFGYNKEGKFSVAGKIDQIMPSIGLNSKV